MNDDFGDKITVKPDIDAVEIVFYELASTPATMYLSPDKARKLVRKINKAINTLEGK